MKRLLLGGLLVCVPLGLSAQPPEGRPSHNDVFAQGPNASRVIVMPPPSGQSAQIPQDGTVTQMPAPNDQPGPNDTVTAPPPLDNPAAQGPLPDNSVTATPLPPAPPPDNQTNSPTEVVPNPLDTANSPPGSGTNQPAQDQTNSPQQLVPNPLDTANSPPGPGTGQPAQGQTNSPQQLVPNPLDTANAPPVPGASGSAQPQGQPESGGWVKMGSATLQALDKANAIEKTLVVKVGDTARFDSLDIAVRGCFVRPPDRPADATAFLVIRDQRSDTPAFDGWMDHAAPYMSMMAHPLYDVRIAGCSP